MDSNHRIPQISYRLNKDRKYALNLIINSIEKGESKSLKELKAELSEDQLFYRGLQHVITTKKALCTALNIPVEAACRYKRYFEKIGKLIESDVAVICPFTHYPAKLITTNSKEFKTIANNLSNQLGLFGEGGQS